MVTGDCLSCVSLIRALVRGMKNVCCEGESGEGTVLRMLGQRVVTEGTVEITLTAASQLVAEISESLRKAIHGREMSELGQVLSFIVDSEVWGGLAACLASCPAQVCECVCLTCVSYVLN